MLRKIIAVLCALSILSANTVVVAQDAAGPPAPLPPEVETLLDDLADVFDEIGGVYADLAAVAEPVDFNPDLLVQALGFDAARIVAHVRDGIAYAPYVGVLNGPDGTLQSGTANSYDQSVLLARLLRLAGYEAQVVVGRLPAEVRPTTGDLGARLPLGARPPQTFADDDAYAALLEELPELQREADAILAELSGILAVEPQPVELPRPMTPARTDDLDALTGWVLDAADLPEAVPLPSHLEEWQTDLYAYARYRRSLNDDWTAVDPALGLAVGELSAADRMVLNDTVPEAHLHTVGVRLMLERALGGAEGETVQLAAIPSAPVANLNADALHMTIQPYAFLAALTGNGQELFVPEGWMLASAGAAVGGGGLAFNTDGIVLPLDALAAPAGGVIATGAGALADATDLLAFEGDRQAMSQALPSLRRLVVQWDVHGPDRRQSFSRVLIDRDHLVAEMEAAGEAVTRDAVDLRLQMALSGTLSFGVGAGRSQPQMLVAESFDLMARLSAALRDGPGEATAAFGLITDLVALQGWQITAWPFATALADWHDPQTAVVRTGAPIVMHRSLVRRDAAGELIEVGMVDIVHEPAVAVAATDDGLVLRPRQTARLALDLAARETATLMQFAEPIAQTSAIDALRTAFAAGVEEVSLGRLDDLPPDLPVTEAQQAHLADLFDRGIVAVLFPGADPAQHVWLEVDTDTGAMRLATGAGGGANTAVYVITLIGIALPLAIGIAGCLLKPNAGGLSCTLCKMGAALTGIVAFAVTAAPSPGANALIAAAAAQAFNSTVCEAVDAYNTYEEQRQRAQQQ